MALALRARGEEGRGGGEAESDQESHAPGLRH